MSSVPINSCVNGENAITIVSSITLFCLVLASYLTSFRYLLVILWSRKTLLQRTNQILQHQIVLVTTAINQNRAQMQRCLTMEAATPATARLLIQSKLTAKRATSLLLTAQLLLRVEKLKVRFDDIYLCTSKFVGLLSTFTALNITYLILLIIH